MNDIHPSFHFFLSQKNRELEELYKQLRAFIYDIVPDSNEILYHTHALTSVYSVSLKPSNGFCHIPIYTNHLNLGFNKGTILSDPHNLLQGTGKLIRHIPIQSEEDFRRKEVDLLIRSAHTLALEDMERPQVDKNVTISKIKM